MRRLPKGTGRKKKMNEMKKMVDILALEREITRRLDVLNADTVFLQTGSAQSKLNTLIERLQALEVIKKHFDLIQWLMGSTDVSRARLIDQDEV